MMEHGLVRKRDGKIGVMNNKWQKFGKHDEVNKVLHHTSHRPRNGKKHGMSAEVCQHIKDLHTKYKPNQRLNLISLS